MCERQEKAKENALQLVDELDRFLSVEHYIPQLKERKETRRAVEHMLKLIAGAATFIAKETSTGWFGVYH